MTGGLFLCAGLFLIAPAFLLIAAVVIYGPFILVFKLIEDIWGRVLLAVLVIGAAWMVYDVFIKKR